jgi:hypothetical protein
MVRDDVHVGHRKNIIASFCAMATNRVSQTKRYIAHIIRLELDGRCLDDKAMEHRLIDLSCDGAILQIIETELCS